jgi:hypothetical protein
MKAAAKAFVLMGPFLPVTLWAACVHPSGGMKALPLQKAEVELPKMLATAP